MKELFVVYEYEKISFLVALKTPQKSEKSMGETSRLRSESLALSQFSEISFLVQLAKSEPQLCYSRYRSCGSFFLPKSPVLQGFSVISLLGLVSSDKVQ